MPAEAGIQGPGGALYAEATPSVNLLAEAATAYVMPAEAGIQWSGGHSSRGASTPSVDLLGEATTALTSCPRRRASSGLGGTPLGRLHTLRRPPWRGHHSAGVMPAKAGIQWSGGALYSGGIHTLHRPPWRGIHTLPSTPSGRPPQPTVMPAEGDVCVTPPVGDSVAEMASIPSGEPHPWIPACAGMTVVQRSPEAGIQWSGGALYSGGIHTLHRPPWRGIHTLPSTPSWRPPQPTVMPTEGDLCVTPPVGDSVAEMASIPSGEPHP